MGGRVLIWETYNIVFLFLYSARLGNYLKMLKIKHYNLQSFSNNKYGGCADPVCEVVYTIYYRNTDI